MTPGPLPGDPWQALAAPPALLGESPFWHPDEAALYWLDIPGRALHRWQSRLGANSTDAASAHTMWAFEQEPACVAPLPGGELLLARRDGLFRFSPASGESTLLCAPPYDPKIERFNDGRADPQGRFWAGTLYEPRNAAHAALYRYAGGALQRMVGDITSSNGLAFAPDGRTVYWADTPAHRVYAFDFDAVEGSLGRQRVFAEFAPKVPGADLEAYGGRPDGAAVDAEGAYWLAMYEGQRLLRFSPEGRVLEALRLPVRCPTMPCFGGPDLRTLFVTTARNGRPAEELAAQPLAGRVLMRRVAVPGLPVNFARL